MKFSTDWLRKFVELPPTIAELTELLTLAGVEIEGIEKRGADFDKVVVAQITASSPHPNADRLTVCQADDGSGKPRQIVCGAKNYAVGDKVALALPGAILPNDLKIRASKLRGVESEGMLCSGKELRVSEESAGLLILPNESQIGAPISTIFGADTILEVEITPNRGDLLSHFGLAREIAALRETKLADLPPGTAAATTPANATIRISALRECPFYSARRIENIVVAPGPEWLRTKIEAVGIRSINYIVDITYYVMLEYGQPLHAFDADKLQGAINVRLARRNEKFIALDGKTYSLGENDLIIADEARAIAIAGVMGGEDTAVTGGTRNVVLESAYFLPASVRRTARELNLPSDASYRFERGVDPELILQSSARASKLIHEIAKGNPAAEIATGGNIPPRPAAVRFRYERCNQLLGIAVKSQAIDRILERFGLQRSNGNDVEGLWQIPSHRSDLQREADLIEEVVRIYGIDRIPSRDRSRFTPRSEADRAYDFEANIRQQLFALGISEARTSALIPRTLHKDNLQLRNPLSEDHVALRPSLLPGLVAALARNIRSGAQSIKLFELGRVFHSATGNESRQLAIVFCGKTESAPHWRAPTKRNLDFFDVKGAIEKIAQASISFRRANHSGHAFAADILSEDKVIGMLGQLTAACAAEVDAASPIIVAEIDLDLIAKSITENKSFLELEKFPPITRDIAMIVPESVTHAEIVAAIEGAKEPLLERVELFDVFAGKSAEGFGVERKSLAYTLTYRNRNRTLTGEEVTVVHARIRERLVRELKVELRE